MSQSCGCVPRPLVYVAGPGFGPLWIVLIFPRTARTIGILTSIIRKIVCLHFGAWVWVPLHGVAWVWPAGAGKTSFAIWGLCWRNFLSFQSNSSAHNSSCYRGKRCGRSHLHLPNWSVRSLMLICISSCFSFWQTHAYQTVPFYLLHRCMYYLCKYG